MEKTIKEQADEKWERVKGFDSYSISDYGNIRNDETGLNLKAGLNGTGYLKVDLYPHKKTRTIHQLVAIAFLNHKPTWFKISATRFSIYPLFSPRISKGKAVFSKIVLSFKSLKS